MECSEAVQSKLVEFADELFKQHVFGSGRNYIQLIYRKHQTSRNDQNHTSTYFAIHLSEYISGVAGVRQGSDLEQRLGGDDGATESDVERAADGVQR